MPALPLSDFSDRTMPVPESGCLVWMGSIEKNGYGRFFVDGHPYYAHRGSWELHRGAIPVGMHVCHKCDVPSCINPNHLFLGTHTDNMADKAAKGRSSSGGRRKLSLDTIIAIRADRRSGSIIAAEYGIRRSHVNRIRSGAAWARL